MILEHSAVRDRLKSSPELMLRLQDFSTSWGVQNLPALVIQRRPVVASSGLELRSTRLEQRLRSGRPSINPTSRWWGSGFSESANIRSTFHGIAYAPPREHAGWALEVHWDGHIVAGTWSFLSPGRDAELAIGDFYADMFHDFSALAHELIEAGGGDSNEEAQYTATLMNADRLYFMAPSSFGQFSVQSKPLALKHLQWPIMTAGADFPAEDVTERMGDMLCGAYGHTRQQSSRSS